MQEYKGHIEELLRSQGVIASKGSIRSFERLHGGSINDSFLLTTTENRLFVKLNKRKDLKNFFSCEKRGLEKLRDASGLRIPRVIAISEEQSSLADVLVLEYLEEEVPAPTFWKNFGFDLAKLHQNSASNFGLDHHNYIGSLTQTNKEEDNWVDFFINHRLEAQYQMARDRNFLDQQFGKDLNRLYGKLNELIPKEKPSLLHGDLWSGNFRIVGAGQAAVFDPAVYYGHREVDLAMMHLFGGFHHTLFDAYHEEFPLEGNWEERIDLFNLYPLLVHVNLFAGSYKSRAQQVLKKYL